MNIRITYPGGRIDVFDTGAYATSAPFGSKNMLTDFEIGLGDIEKEGLWLVANYYAAKPEFRKGAAGIPVARRSRGWRFLLSTAEEAKELCDVTVDGEMVIARVAESEVVLGDVPEGVQVYAFVTCSYQTDNSRTVVYAVEAG